MSDPNVEVKFTARTDGVESGAALSAEAIKKSVAAMKESFDGLLSSVKDIQSQMSGLFEGMQAGLAKFNNVMFAVQNAISGGSMFKEFVASSMETTKEAVALGKAFGITATEASYLRAAANNVGISYDTLQAAGGRLTRTILTNEDAIKNLGVATRDNEGHFRNTSDVMQDVNARLRDFKEGTDRNVEGMKIYGREWSNIAPLVSKFKGVTEESRQEAEALNLVVGQEAVSAMADYKTAQLAVGDVMEGMKNTIGQALLPGLTDLANWFRSIGPDAVQAVNIAMNGYLVVQKAVKDSVMTLWKAATDAFSAIGDAVAAVFGGGGKGPTAMEFFRMVIESITVLFIGFRISIEEGVSIIRGVFEELANEGRLVGGVLYAALHLDLAGVKAAWADFKSSTTATMQKTMDEAVAIAAKGRVDIEKVLGGSLTERKTQTAIQTKEGGERSDGKAAEKQQEDDRIAMWRDALRRQLDVSENYFKDSTAEELAYWSNILATETLTTKESYAINAQMFALKRKLAHDERDQELAEIDGQRKIKSQELALQKANLDQLKETQEISDAEYLRRLARVHQAEIDSELAAVAAKLEIVKEEGKQRQQLLDEQQRLQAKRNLQTVIDANATANAVLKSWQEVFKPLENTLASVFDGLLKHTMTLRQAMSSMFSAILTEATSWVAKMIVQWIAKEAAQTAATAAGVATRGGIESSGAAMSVMTWAGAAIKNIMNSAWEAMAGAFKAIAGIPYVGPVLAPAAGAAAFAAVAGMAGSVASARSGFDIPAGVNPLTQLHEREMVLPQKQADAVRKMADGGDTGGNAAPQIHFHGQKLRGGFWMMHQDDLVKTVVDAHRKFKLGGS